MKAYLIKEATDAAIFRGHDLMRHWKYHSGGHIGINMCHKCGKEVQINDRPLPNEIDVSGEAVALNCTS